MDTPVRTQNVTVTSPRIWLTVAPSGRLLDIEFTAVFGATSAELSRELLRLDRVARGVEPAGPGMVVDTVPADGGLFDPTPDVPVPQLPQFPTEADLQTYRRQLDEASRHQWAIGLARGRGMVREGEGATRLARVRATGAGVLLDVTFRAGVGDAEPSAVKSDFLEALALAVRAAVA